VQKDDLRPVDLSTTKEEIRNAIINFQRKNWERQRVRAGIVRQGKGVNYQGSSVAFYHQPKLNIGINIMWGEAHTRVRPV